MRKETEAAVETLQHTLLEVIRLKFPELTELAQEQIRRFTDPGALDLLFQKVLTAPDVKTVRWLLEPIG